jgi:hypothetical protein
MDQDLNHWHPNMKLECYQLNHYVPFLIQKQHKFQPLPLTVTFKQPGWYSNFSTQFMKNVLLELKKIKL